MLWKKTFTVYSSSNCVATTFSCEKCIIFHTSRKYEHFLSKPENENTNQGKPENILVLERRHVNCLHL